MRRFSVALVFISLSFITVLAQGDTANWISVGPDKSGFSVLMPGKPTEKVTPVEGAPGVEYHEFSLETSAAAYVFSYTQYPKEVTDRDAIKGMLDAGRDGALAASGAQLKAEKEIKVSEYAGREWLVDLPAGLSATNRAFWVRDRFYQLVFVVAPNARDTAETLKRRQELANKFFDSFRLISESGH